MTRKLGSRRGKVRGGYEARRGGDVRRGLGSTIPYTHERRSA